MYWKYIIQSIADDRITLFSPSHFFPRCVRTHTNTHTAHSLHLHSSTYVFLRLMNGFDNNNLLHLYVPRALYFNFARTPTETHPPPYKWIYYVLKARERNKIPNHYSISLLLSTTSISSKFLVRSDAINEPWISTNTITLLLLIICIRPI